MNKRNHKKSKRCVPTSFSVPSDLLKEMRKLPNVNWSAIACGAFRKYLQGDVEVLKNSIAEIVMREVTEHLKERGILPTEEKK